MRQEKAWKGSEELTLYRHQAHPAVPEGEWPSGESPVYLGPHLQELCAHGTHVEWWARAAPKEHADWN